MSVKYQIFLELSIKYFCKYQLNTGIPGSAVSS